MAIHGVNIGPLITPWNGPQAVDVFGPLVDGMKWQREQARLRQNAEAEQAIQRDQTARLRQQNAFEQQRGVAKIAADSEEARQKLAAEQKSQQAKLSHEQDAELVKRQDEGIKALHEAIKSGNPTLIDAATQELKRRGFNVESGDKPADPGLELKSGDAPSMEAPPKKAPALAGQLDRMGDALSGRIRGGSAGGKHSGLPEPSGMPRPRPGRSAGLTGPLDQPWGNASATPGIGAAPGVVAQPWADGGPSRIPPAAPPMRAAPPEPGPALPEPPAPRENVPPLPSAPPERQGFSGVRIRDKRSGDLVYEFDPSKLNEQRGAGALGALGVLGEGARDDEESRAATMTYKQAQSLIAGGLDPEKAYEQASKEYQFELGRLGKKRVVGGGSGGAPAPSGISKGERAEDQIAISRVKDIRNKYLTEEETKAYKDTIAGLQKVEQGAKSNNPVEQIGARLATIKALQQDSRMSNKDQDMLNAVGGVRGRMEQVLNEYAGKGEIPKQVLAELDRSAQSVRALAEGRLKSAGDKARSAIFNDPYVKKYAKDEKFRKELADNEAGLISGTSSTEPAADAPPAVTPAPGKAAAAPAKPKSDRDLADALIGKM